MADYEPIRVTAERIGRSRETIRQWAQAGYFPGAERPDVPGSQWLIPAGAKPVFTTAPTTKRVIRRRKA